MPTEAKKELIRLYELAISATATTNFYNQAYKYVGFVKQSNLLSEIIEKDDAELHEQDIEKHKTAPKQHEGEGDGDYFVKRMRHMDSGEDYFLSHLFFKLEHFVYDFIDWYYADGFQSEEASIMLHGRKKFTILDKIKKYFHRHDIGYDRTDYNKKYIDNFQYWKKLLVNFHTKLLVKIEEVPITPEPKLKNEAILTLYPSGKAEYRGESYNLNPSGREYKALILLIEAPDYSAHYSDLAKALFQKEDSKSIRREVQQLVKKLKLSLGIQAGNEEDKLLENLKRWGYRLSLKENEATIIKP